MNKYIKLIGKKAKKVIERKIDTKTKNKVLKSFLVFLTKNEKKILNQNKKDIKFARKKKKCGTGGCFAKHIPYRR